MKFHTLSERCRGSFNFLSCFDLFVGDPDHCGCADVDIFFCRHPGGHADPHGCYSLPYRAATPAGAIVLDFFDDPVGQGCVTKGNEHLVKGYLVEDMEACLF